MASQSGGRDATKSWTPTASGPLTRAPTPQGAHHEQAGGGGVSRSATGRAAPAAGDPVGQVVRSAAIRAGAYMYLSQDDRAAMLLGRYRAGFTPPSRSLPPSRQPRTGIGTSEAADVRSSPGPECARSGAPLLCRASRLRVPAHAGIGAVRASTLGRIAGGNPGSYGHTPP